MRIIPFPSKPGRPAGSLPDERDPAATTLWLIQLDDALHAGAAGPAAESWRQLQQDVRALAPPLDPAFERALHERLTARRARPAARGTRLRVPALGRRPALAALATVAALAIAVPAAIVANQGRGSGSHVVAGSSGRATPADETFPPSSSVAAPAERKQSSAPASAEATVSPGAAASSGAAVPAQSGRLQQRAASITLTSSPSGVQQLADSVSALAAADGGFVVRSQVQQQSKGASEAQMTLQLPSGKLASALAALGRLAPVQSQSQSLEDITSSYQQARGRLSDAVAERDALLKALAKATTPEEVESLHERIAQARAAIGRAAGEVKAVARRAANSEVEVTVLGTQHSQSGGLTLDRGLHDVGRVLLVTFVGLAIAAAVLVPLALVGLLTAGAWRVWTRRRRERVLSRA